MKTSICGNEYIGKSCLFSSLKAAADKFGICLPEYIVHSMSVGWEVAYQSPNRCEDFLLFPNIKLAVEQFALHAQLKTDTVNLPQDTEKLIQLAGENSILLIVVDPSVLPYMERTFDSIITREMHFLLLLYDTKDKGFYVPDPYTVDKKGNVKSYFGAIETDDFAQHIQQCYILSGSGKRISDPHRFIYLKIRDFLDGKEYSWIPPKNDTVTYFGIHGCKKLLCDWMQTPCFNKDLVRLAFFIKTNCCYVFDFFACIQRNAKWNIECRTQKDNWNQIYFRLLRNGYRKPDEKANIEALQMVKDELDNFEIYIEEFIRKPV